MEASMSVDRRNFIRGTVGLGAVLSWNAFGAGLRSATAVQPGSTVADGGLSYDVVIYGATLAGMMAAVRAHCRGLRVCVVEPSRFVGGVIAGGLVNTDTPLKWRTDSSKTEIHGLTASLFFDRIGALEIESGAVIPAGTDPRYQFEAKIAARVAAEVLHMARASVFLGRRLTRRTDVIVDNNTIRAIRAGSEWIRGSFFVDASYEGDLMALAGVPYTVGREGSAQYGESYAGYYPAGAVTLTGFRDNTAYPAIPDSGENAGQGDDRVQSYNFRCIVADSGELVPFRRPQGYRASRYDVILDEISILNKTTPITTFLQVVGKQSLLPNGKVQTNSLAGSLLGTDLPGRSWRYPDGSWSERDDIVAEHVAWQQGLFYWLVHDCPIAAIRADAARYGLPADEFGNSPYGHGWPHSLYVREARRMIGDYVLTQKDQNAPHNTKLAPVCEWQYARDSHIVQVFSSGADSLVGEGGTGVLDWWGDPGDRVNHVDVYQIPASSLYSAEVRNLTVPICMSASHVGYMTTRMEPAYGMMGEACGEIAALCLRYGIGAPDIIGHYAELRTNLQQYGAGFSL